MLRNVRLSCCVAGNSHLTLKEDDMIETLELLSERLGPWDPPERNGPPWVNDEHPLAFVELSLRSGTSCKVG